MEESGKMVPPHRATEAAFLITGCPSPKRGTSLREHVPQLIQDMD